MMKRKLLLLLCISISFLVVAQKPNVIIIYADDLGYGDLSCYGATKIHTPNLDKLAKQGLRFTNAHSTSATCTPSRYALMTGQYPWRRTGTNILPGDAALIVPTNKITLPKVFKQAGYQTAIVGKWHLGLGDQVEKNWNGEIKPGPNETGFDYSFIFPATADRVPTVFVENHYVVGLDTADPIQVDYHKKIGNDPTGAEHPELLKMRASPNHGHNNTIVNGIGRIGFMSGGKTARWTDEEMPLTFLEKAKEFIDVNKSKPFFLFYTLTEPHVPRMPSTMFKGKSGLGFRGDAILQLDWAVGEIMKQVKAAGIEKNTIIIFSSDNGPVLDDGYVDGAVGEIMKQVKAAGIEKNTIIIFSSDNGPVLDDGYVDGAVTQLNGHTPNGPFRGGKYSALEAGTRIPFIMNWPGKVHSKTFDALICQIDLLASFASLLHVPFANGEATDSKNMLPALLGKSNAGRSELVTQGGALSIIKDGWKYIEPNNGPANTGPLLTNIETGNAPHAQLYHLAKDKSESINLAGSFPGKVKELAALLEKIKQNKH